MARPGLSLFPLLTSGSRLAPVIQLWLCGWGNTLGVGRVTRWKEYGSLGDIGWQNCPTHRVKEKWTYILLKLLYSWSLHYVSSAHTLMNTPGLCPLELHSLRLSHLPTHLIVGGGGAEMAQNLPLTFTWRIVLCGFNLYNDLTYVTLTNIFSVIFRNSLIDIVNLTSNDIDRVEVSCVSVFLIAHAFLIAHIETKQLCEFGGCFKIQDICNHDNLIFFVRDQEWSHLTIILFVCLF